MPTPASLRADAYRLEQQAADASDVAAALQRRYDLLEQRLRPVLRLHTEEVWQSRAATASRMTLMVSCTGELGRARTELWTLIEALRRKAINFENHAAGNRRRADQLEADAQAAGAPYLPDHLAPPDYEPYEEPVVVPTWGIR